MRKALMLAGLMSGISLFSVGSANAVEIEYWQYIYETRVNAMDQLIEKFEAALESVYGSAHALASQARYRSDLGTIAILNAYGYHPLLEELQALYEAEEDLEEP